MQKSRYVKVIEGKEFGEGGMAVEVPQNGKISGGGKDGRRKGVGSAILRRRANRGSINIKE